MPLCNTAICAAAEANDELMNLLTKYWSIENTLQRRYRTNEEQQCEDIFTSSIIRDQTGRFIAKIPLKPNAPKVVGSRQLALARLKQMHRRFPKDSDLREKYVKFMTEYESLSHMSFVPKNELYNENAIYIPHHAACPSKFRVVFDGSCKS